MNAAEARDDAATCPICGGPNLCAMAAGLVDESCWCAQIEFAPGVLDKVPVHERRERCICPRCAVQR
jgi:hypothetical protein